MSDTNYTLLESQLTALVGDEIDPLANASNFVGLLFAALDDIDG